MLVCLFSGHASIDNLDSDSTQAAGLSEVVKYLQLGFDRHEIIVVHLSLCLEVVDAERAREAIAFVTHEQLISGDSLLELLHLAAQEVQLLALRLSCALLDLAQF